MAPRHRQGCPCPAAPLTSILLPSRDAVEPCGPREEDFVVARCGGGWDHPLAHLFGTFTDLATQLLTLFLDHHGLLRRVKAEKDTKTGGASPGGGPAGAGGEVRPPRGSCASRRGEPGGRGCGT